MNRIETAIATSKKFVVKHKTKLAVAATIAVAVKTHATVVGQHNDFLKEHGLYEAFYAQIED